MLEIRRLVGEYEEGKDLKPKVKTDLKSYLLSVLDLSRGDVRHGKRDLVEAAQSDIEEDLYTAGISRDDLNKLSGKLLGVEDMD